MKAKGRTYIALFLIFSFMMLSVNLSAKKHGAKLIITKKDRTQFKGELITVKQDSLLMLVHKEKDVSVDIRDIEKIVILNKSKLKIGGLSGCAIGGAAGCYIGSKDEYEPLGASMLYGTIGANIGLLVGVLTGLAAIPNEVILIEGMTDSEIQETLEKLRRKALIRNYK